MLLRRLFLLCVFCSLALSLGVARADVTAKTLAPGVVFTQEIDKKTPLIIDVLDINLRAPGVHVGVGIGQDKISGTDASKGREDVSRYARRHGLLGVINADFFPFTGDPLGLGIQNGELFSEPWTGGSKGGPRTALGLAADGQSVLLGTLGFLGDLQAADGARYFISGINRLVGAGEIVAFTSLYGLQAAVKAGGATVTVRRANLPVGVDKLIVGQVETVDSRAALPAPIPADGVVLSAGPGAGAEFLRAHCKPGDTLGFVLSVAPPGQTHDGVAIASLAAQPQRLASRGLVNIGRGALLWSGVREAVSGGPRLLQDGQVAVSGAAEGFDAGFTDHAYPRTAVGVSRDGRHLIWVAIEGRQALSRGATLTETAQILRRYGAWNAVNLDGGGSTSMAVAGLAVGSPEGGASERPVADMLTVSSDAAHVRWPADAPLALPAPNAPGTLTAQSDTQPNVQIVTPSGPVLTGSSTLLRLRVGTRTLSGADPRILWQGAAGGTGFVTQRGYFLAQKPGTGTVAALFDGRLITGSVSVQSALPVPSTYALRVALSPDPQGAANRNALFVRVLDKNNAPKAGAAIHLVVLGGVADTPDTFTDPDGGVTVGITWNQGSGGSVQIVSPGLVSVVLTQPGNAAIAAPAP